MYTWFGLRPHSLYSHGSLAYKRPLASYPTAVMESAHSPTIRVCLVWSVCALPILTGSRAQCANGLGASGLVSRPLTNPYQLPHARAIGFWFGQGGLYQLLPYITMPPF